MGRMTGTFRRQGRSLIDWSLSAVRPPGESESGDMALVKPVTNGVLMAAVDGAGHGREAANAARIAVSTLKEHAGEGIVALLRLCHLRLRGTRGAVVSLVSFDGERNEMKWLGVGNVSGLLVRRREHPGALRQWILLKGGVLGYALPPLQPQIIRVLPGDTIALATDGIHPDFMKDVDSETPLQTLASRLCARYATGCDDGMMLVARYLGWNT
ncbi:MAG TPA: SpoIIE family protein phosphatase [Bryobacteraceae bacterium]|nr:SpoIIE family protein phosphatase [Bryobacteraceae bacterium]